MTRTMIQVDHVWKKFRKGEIHDSLRELIPAVAKRLIRRGTKGESLGNREFWALQDVSFEVGRGESLGIIGPNGAGKSTMLKMLSRIIKPNRGSYHVNGRISALIEVGAGFHQDLTGRENIYLNGTILGMSRKQIRAKEEQIIDFAGVEDFIETPVKRYSSGMKARLGFAVAAHMEPDVLLVDEVLSVGDAKFRRKCINHMQQLIQSDVTVVFISHLLEQVRSLCPNTVVLDKGEVVYHGPTDGAIRKYMDVLGNDDNEDQSESDAFISNAQICDAQGNPVPHWVSNQPGRIEFDLVIKQPLVNLLVLINVSSINGTYLGTINSIRDGLEIRGEPGTYRLGYTVDHLPLGGGDYSLQFVISELHKRRVWDGQQPHLVSVQDNHGENSHLYFNGDWEQIGHKLTHSTIH